MSNAPSIPTLFVGNADLNTNNEQITLDGGRDPLVLGGPARLLTREEFDEFPSRLGVVLEREGSEPSEMTVKALKEELDHSGVSYKGNAKQEELAAQVVELRAAAVANAAAAPTSDAGSQLSAGDNPSVTPPSL